MKAVYDFRTPSFGGAVGRRLSQGEEDASNDIIPSIFDATNSAVSIAAKMPVGRDFCMRSLGNKAVQRALRETEASIGASLTRFIKLGAAFDLKDGGVLADAGDNVGEFATVAAACEALLEMADIATEFSERHPDATMAQHSTVRTPVVEAPPTNADRRPVQLPWSAKKISPTRAKKHCYVDYVPQNRRTRFVPILVDKPFSTTEIPNSIRDAQQYIEHLERSQKAAAENNAPFNPKPDSSEPLPHPYATELNQLDFREDVAALNPSPPKHFRPLQSTPLEIIVTLEELTHLVEELQDSVAHPVIAIDLEHHDAHSYYGFTCLIQISTREKDYIIDPFALKDHLQLLNRFTANPQIMKVLHGAASDIIWLQRDFGVYVVGLFDTFFASKELQIPGGNSLSNLLSYYCQESTNKMFQKADWRERPLSQEKLRYARMDTHFLLYIYDIMRNQLLCRTHRLEGGGLISGNEGGLKATEMGVNAFINVMELSRDLCLRVHSQRDSIDGEQDAIKICSQFHVNLKKLEFDVLRELLCWRDDLARSLDESTGFILSTANLIKVAKAMPRSFDALQSSVAIMPAVLRRHGREIVDIILNARGKSLEEQLTDTAPPAKKLKTNHVSHPPTAAATATTVERPQYATTSVPFDRKLDTTWEFLLDRRARKGRVVEDVFGKTFSTSDFDSDSDPSTESHGVSIQPPPRSMGGRDKQVARIFFPDMEKSCPTSNEAKTRARAIHNTLRATSRSMVLGDSVLPPAPTPWKSQRTPVSGNLTQQPPESGAKKRGPTSDAQQQEEASLKPDVTAAPPLHKDCTIGTFSGMVLSEKALGKKRRRSGAVLESRKVEDSGGQKRKAVGIMPPLCANIGSPVSNNTNLINASSEAPAFASSVAPLKPRIAAPQVGGKAKSPAKKSRKK